MAEAPPQNEEGRASPGSGNVPFSVRPLSSGAPLRRSPKLSNLSVGSINETQNDIPVNPPVYVDGQDPDENQESQEVPLSQGPKLMSEQSEVEGNDLGASDILPPPEEFAGPDTTLGNNVAISTSDGDGAINPLELNTSPNGPEGTTETPSGGQISATGSRESNKPLGVAKPPGIIKPAVQETPRLETVELGSGAADTVAITLDVPVSGTSTQPVVLPIPIRVVSTSVAGSPENTKRRTIKKGKGSAGGDFGERTVTASNSSSYPSSYESSVVKSKKGKDPKFWPQPQDPQYQYQNQNYNNYQEEPSNRTDQAQLPSVVKGMGAISFKVPGRITHKTTIKIAHYPQAGNEIISVEQPVPTPYGPNVDGMGMEEYSAEDDYGGCGGGNGGQGPNGSYTNNCNFATYNVTDSHQNQMDPNTMMQMQMMQQHQAYGNPYGGNGGYYPYGYPPY